MTITNSGHGTRGRVLLNVGRDGLSPPGYFGVAGASGFVR
jgi:hypothetical protein